MSTASMLLKGDNTAAVRMRSQIDISCVKDTTTPTDILGMAAKQTQRSTSTVYMEDIETMTNTNDVTCAKVTTDAKALDTPEA